jgi:hypothetical protein
MTVPVDTAGLRELLAKATPGPWEAREPDSPLHVLISANPDDCDGSRNGGIYAGRTQGPDAIPNAALIVALRNAAEWLCDRSDRLDAMEAALREAESIINSSVSGNAWRGARQRIRALLNQEQEA